MFRTTAGTSARRSSALCCGRLATTPPSRRSSSSWPRWTWTITARWGWSTFSGQLDTNLTISEDYCVMAGTYPEHIHILNLGEVKASQMPSKKCDRIVEMPRFHGWIMMILLLLFVRASSPDMYNQFLRAAVQYTGHCSTFRVNNKISAANRLIGEVVQSRRRPLLGPSPG